MYNYYSMKQFPFKILRVAGHSMEPTIKAGSYILINQWIKKYKTGDIVACNFENYIILKRIVQLNDSMIQIHGDNLSDSLDSRTFGEISRSSLIGKVIRL